MPNSPLHSAGGVSGARKRLFVGLSLVLVFAFSLALDRSLALFGFSDEEPLMEPLTEVQVDNLEYHYSFKTNDRGLHYRAVATQKPQGLYRVVVLGDSFTEGLGVSDSERWTDLVEARLNGQGTHTIDFINCAQPSTGPTEYAKTLFGQCMAYEPDLVLIGIYFNDVLDTNTDVRVPDDLLPRERTGIRKIVHALWPHMYVLTKRTLSKRREFEPFHHYDDLLSWAEEEGPARGIPEERIEEWRRSVPPDLIRAANELRINPAILLNPLLNPTFYYDSLNLDSEVAREKFAKMSSILSFIVAECRRSNIETIVAFLPSEVQYDPLSSEHFSAKMHASLGAPMREEWLRGDSTLQLELRRWASSDQITFWDLTSDFRERAHEFEGDLNYAIDSHWTPLGHRVAADTITRQFREFLAAHPASVETIAN